MKIFHERSQNLKARQTLERHYMLNGAIYLVDIKYLMSCSDVFQEGCYSYHMPRERSADIDTQEDFDWCEYHLERSRKK